MSTGESWGVQVAIRVNARPIFSIQNTSFVLLTIRLVTFPIIARIPEMSNAEAGFLKAFDAMRKRIHEVSDSVYTRGGKGYYAYILAAGDF